MEMQLEVEMQCREIMKVNDLDNLKRFCTHLVRKKFDQDIFMASMLNRLIELEATLAVLQTRTKKSTGIYKLRWWLEQFYMHLKYRHITKRYSHRA